MSANGSPRMLLGLNLAILLDLVGWAVEWNYEMVEEKEGTALSDVVVYKSC